MTSPDVPPVAAEAREAAFAAWDQATVQQPGCDQPTHAAWQAAWAAALHWAAQLAEQHNAMVTEPHCNASRCWERIPVAPFAGLLREGGGT